MLHRFLTLLFGAALAASAQKYDGPVPPKADVPYLKHASQLISTEVAEAREEKKKDDVTYVIEGAGSSVKTPLSSPVFLFQADKIVPARLGLYRLDTKNKRREILFAPKKQPKAIRLEVNRLTGNVYKIEVNESLEPGEYSLTPQGSNQVFCFQVY